MMAAVEPDTTIPHALDAEQALLGAVLHHPAALDGVRHILEPGDFGEPVNGALYAAMCAKRDAGEHIDITLVRLTVGNGDLGGQTVGQYLAALGASATTISGAPSYARLVRSAAQMRRVLETAQHAVSTMTDGSVFDPAEFAARMIEDLDEVASSSAPDSLKRVTLGRAAAGAIERIVETRSGKARRGAPYGIPALDRATLGLRDDQLVILAGRPGMGKTTAAMHFAMSTARHGFGVAFVSLEMSAEELAERALAAAAYDPRETDYITYRAIAEGTHISDEALNRLRRARTFCEALPLEIEQQPGLTLSQIASRVRQIRTRLERTGRFLSVLIVDHIGLVRPSKRYSGNRVQEISEISSGLKALAKELNIAVIGLSQLNRSVESREDKRPVLSDLRDSGSIEQDADVVIGLFRESYYLERKPDPSVEEADRLVRVKDTLEIEILKQRSGPTPRITCFCDIACNVLSEMA